MAGICLEMRGPRNGRGVGGTRLATRQWLKDVRRDLKTFLFYVLGIFHAKKIFSIGRAIKMFRPLVQ